MLERASIFYYYIKQRQGLRVWFNASYLSNLQSANRGCAAWHYWLGLQRACLKSLHDSVLLKHKIIQMNLAACQLYHAHRLIHLVCFLRQCSQVR